MAKNFSRLDVLEMKQIELLGVRNGTHIPRPVPSPIGADRRWYRTESTDCATAKGFPGAWQAWPNDGHVDLLAKTPNQRHEHVSCSVVGLAEFKRRNEQSPYRVLRASPVCDT